MQPIPFVQRAVSAVAREVAERSRRLHLAGLPTVFDLLSSKQDTSSGDEPTR